MLVKSLQSCPPLCKPMDCSPPGSSVHGILLARTLEWVAMPSSRGSPDPGIERVSPAFAGSFFTTVPSGTPEPWFFKTPPQTRRLSAFMISLGHWDSKNKQRASYHFLTLAELSHAGWYSASRGLGFWISDMLWWLVPPFITYSASSGPHLYACGCPPAPASTHDKSFQELDKPFKTFFREEPRAKNR